MIDAEGFPLTIDGKEAFTGYAAISQADFDKLTDAQFEERRAAFQAYIESLYPGITVSWSTTKVYDDVTCPIPSAHPTYIISNLTGEGTNIVEFDISVSDNSTQTIPYRLFVRRNDTDPLNRKYSVSAAVALEGGITTTLYASGGIIDNYSNGFITITGSAHIKMTIYAMPNVLTMIARASGSIKFNDDNSLTVNSFINELIEA